MNQVVVIQCLVYNHEKYLRDCLDGFVMQQTNFPFKAIVHDDASTDSSSQIIEEYAQKYPDIIIPCIKKINQYSRGAEYLSQSFRNAVSSFPSKYLAICEGDDCWIDPNKLQNQVNFLDTHPDYSMCFHKAIERWEDCSKPDSEYCNFESREYKYFELFQKLAVPTASVMFRREIYDSDYYQYVFSTVKTHFRDNLTWYCCKLSGKMMCLDFIGSVYRRQNSGISLSVTPLIHLKNNFEYYKVFKSSDKEMAISQMLYDIPQLLIDLPRNSKERKEVINIANIIGIKITLKACIPYYFKMILRRFIPASIWESLKSVKNKSH